MADTIGDSGDPEMPAGPKAEAARQILVAVNGAPTSIRVGVYLCVPTNPPKQLAHATAHELWTNKPCIEYWCRDKPVQFAFPDPVKEALDVAQSDPPNLGQRLCYAFITILYYLLRDKKLHEFNALRDAAAVTHRIPYGGKFVEHQLVISPDDTIFDYLHDYAPEDNPAHLALVLETFRQCRGVKQLLCFDTIYPASGSTTRPGDIIAQNTIAQSGGFNSFIDPDVQNTPGLHGVSYVGVLEQVSKYMRIDANRLNLIVCHLGNTSSVGVIQYGKCISFKKDFIGAKRASKNQIMWAMEEMSRAPHKVHGNSLKALFDKIRFNSGWAAITGTNEFALLSSLNHDRILFPKKPNSDPVTAYGSNGALEDLLASPVDPEYEDSPYGRRIRRMESNSLYIPPEIIGPPPRAGPAMPPYGEEIFNELVDDLAEYCNYGFDRLNGYLSAFVFTGGIGSNDVALRHAVIQRLANLEIVHEPNHNKRCTDQAGLKVFEISSQFSKNNIYVVFGDECRGMAHIWAVEEHCGYKYDPLGRSKWNTFRYEHKASPMVWRDREDSDVERWPRRERQRIAMKGLDRKMEETRRKSAKHVARTPTRATSTAPQTNTAIVSEKARARLPATIAGLYDEVSNSSTGASVQDNADAATAEGSTVHVMPEQSTSNDVPSQGPTTHDNSEKSRGKLRSVLAGLYDDDAPASSAAAANAEGPATRKMSAKAWGKKRVTFADDSVGASTSAAAALAQGDVEMANTEGPPTRGLSKKARGKKRAAPPKPTDCTPEHQALVRFEEAEDNLRELFEPDEAPPEVNTRPVRPNYVQQYALRASQRREKMDPRIINRRKFLPDPDNPIGYIDPFVRQALDDCIAKAGLDLRTCTHNDLVDACFVGAHDTATHERIAAELIAQFDEEDRLAAEAKARKYALKMERAKRKAAKAVTLAAAATDKEYIPRRKMLDRKEKLFKDRKKRDKKARKAARAAGVKWKKPKYAPFTSDDEYEEKDFESEEESGMENEPDEDAPEDDYLFQTRKKEVAFKKGQEHRAGKIEDALGEFDEQAMPSFLGKYAYLFQEGIGKKKKKKDKNRDEDDMEEDDDEDGDEEEDEDEEDEDEEDEDEDDEEKDEEDDEEDDEEEDEDEEGEEDEEDEEDEEEEGDTIVVAESSATAAARPRRRGTNYGGKAKRKRGW